MSASVALITSNRGLQRHLRRTVVSLGYSAHPCTYDREQLDEELQHDRDIYLVDLEASQTEVLAVLEVIHQKKDATSVVIPVDTTDADFIVNLLETNLTRHLFSRRLNPALAHEVKVRALPPSPIDEQELAVICRKIAGKQIFGLDKHLFTWGIRLHELKLDNSEQKPAVLAEIDSFLDKLDCHRAITPSITLAVDELLMNAFFNAPRNEAGLPSHVGIDRREMVSVDKPISISWGCDGRYIGLSVCDHYGSLAPETIIHYVKHSLTGSPAQTEEKEHGAGLGLYMIFNSVNHLIFNLKEGEKTEVIALFYIRDGGRVFRSSGRSLHVFSDEYQI